MDFERVLSISTSCVLDGGSSFRQLQKWWRNFWAHDSGNDTWEKTVQNNAVGVISKTANNVYTFYWLSVWLDRESVGRQVVTRESWYLK